MRQYTVIQTLAISATTTERIPQHAHHTQQRQSRQTQRAGLGNDEHQIGGETEPARTAGHKFIDEAAGAAVAKGPQAVGIDACGRVSECHCQRRQARPGRSRKLRRRRRRVVQDGATVYAGDFINGKR